jgi:hypothetical protein
MLKLFQLVAVVTPIRFLGRTQQVEMATLLDLHSFQVLPKICQSLRMTGGRFFLKTTM